MIKIMNERRVVVTGLGALTPIGNDVDHFWNSLLAGVSGAAPIRAFDAAAFKTLFACELKDFEVAAYLDPKEARIHDRYTHLALIASQQALGDADLMNHSIDSEKIGVIWGTGNGGFQSFEAGVASFVENDKIPRFNPYFIPKTLVNMAAGVLALKFGFKGLTFAPVSACATGNTALIEAMHHISWGTADVILTGASDAAISTAGIGGFNAIRALSTRNDDSATASRPFDKDRDGFVMGEGAGAIILEERSHAIARGAKIYAEIVGGAMTSDAYHLTASHPEGEGAQRAMKQTLAMAGIDRSEVDLINAHATSTGLGDKSEAKAIEAVYGQHQPIVSATKSMTGHLLGAAAAIEAIAVIKSIEIGWIPATINTTVLDESIPDNFNILLGSSKEKQVHVAMSNAFGFGGHNATVLFKSHN
ncbi:MAG: 3-oxoacyl-[acyl-carrier-protein] synthase II [Cyclobacteriaceae bacterium]|jgi:3-oxoacyl-[acyl-carrier-protein] synthase II